MAYDDADAILRNLTSWREQQRIEQLTNEARARTQTVNAGGILPGLMATIGQLLQGKGLNLTPTFASTMGELARASSGSDQNYGSQMYEGLNKMLPVAPQGAKSSGFSKYRVTTPMQDKFYNKMNDQNYKTTYTMKPGDTEPTMGIEERAMDYQAANYKMSQDKFEYQKQKDAQRMKLLLSAQKSKATSTNIEDAYMGNPNFGIEADALMRGYKGDRAGWLKKITTPAYQQVLIQNKINPKDLKDYLNAIADQKQLNALSQQIGYGLQLNED